MEATETSLNNLSYNEIVFPRLGIDIHLNSTAFTIFGIDVQWYGLIITLGLLLAMIYAFTQMKQYGIDPDRAIDAIIGGIVGGVVGARLYYVLLEWDHYAGDWKSIFNLRQGGLAIYGGLIGSVLVGCLVAKLRKVPILPLLDICSIGFLLGQGIGRWGNFFNQEAFGKNTDSLFGMSGGRIQNWISDQNGYLNTNFYLHFGEELSPDRPVHPCFLYESIWCLVGFVLLALFAKKIRKFDGQIFLTYIAWYGLGRFFIEGLRVDSLVIGNVRVSQALAAVCVIVSVILQIVFLSRVKRMGGEYQLYKATQAAKDALAAYEARNQKSVKEINVAEETESDADSEPVAQSETDAAEDAGTPAAEAEPVEETESTASEPEEE